ncbi:MAG TPA: hypothetical protein VFZ81_16760 [Burkholderiales bacterium]
MKKIVSILAAGLLVGAFAVSHAKLPAPSAEQKAAAAAKAEKDAAAKGKAAELLGRAQDKAAANYKKNKAASMGAMKK